MALLPPEFRRAQEGAGGLFPAHHRAPLVILEGQVAVGLHPLGEHGAENGFTGGTHGQAFLELFGAALGDPGHFGGEAFHVVGFLQQQGFGNQHGHGHVFVARILEHLVQLLMDQFPDAVAVGLERHAAAHGGVVHQVGLGDHVGIPLGEILVPGGDVLHEFLFLFLCHEWIPSSKNKSLVPLQGRSHASRYHLAWRLFIKRPAFIAL